MSIYQYTTELRFLNALCIAALKLYKNHLDDRKWFKCAYKAVYGGKSCTAFMMEVLHEKPFIEAFTVCYIQLKNCEKASSVACSRKHLKHHRGKTYILIGSTYMLVSACTGDNSPPTPPPIDPSDQL